MRKNNRKRQVSSQSIVIVCLVILVFVAVGIIAWLILQKNDPNAVLTTATTTANPGLVVPERPEMLDITAYESITLKADTLEQSVRFDNPLQNNSWLVITLSLEDGTVLWQSEELQPGQVVRSITLNQPLAAGEYQNAVLTYSHWTFDEEKLPLNGAETLVTIKVE